MKPILSACVCLLLLTSISAQQEDEQVIRKILRDQTLAWNQGDLEGFMKGYWQNDSLLFIGKRGLTYGWKNTLENYKKGYPDTAAMGKLFFDIKIVKRLSPDYFHVIGKWHLQRTAGDLEGHYTLLFRKIRNQWVIVADHSS